MRHIIFSIFFTAAAALSAATPVQRGDSAYAKGDYRRAVTFYEQSLQKDGPAASVYFNLGNAHYRTGNTGGAVLAYERALRLNPSDKDARANLEFVNSRIEDRPEDDRSFLTKKYDSLVIAADPDTWAWVTLGIFAACLGAIALYVFGHGVLLRKTGFFGGIALLFLTVAGLVVSHDAAKRVKDHDEAVVTARSTLLSSEPRAPKGGKDKVVALHEGTKVVIVDSASTPDDPVSPKYYDVKINNSTRAWVRASDVERI